MIHSKLESFFTGHFSDKRIDARANKFLSSIITRGSSTINNCCMEHSEKIGAYRLLNNDNCNLSGLSQALYASCGNNVLPDHLLCIQDTTELNYISHLKRIKKEDPDIGPGGCAYAYGFFCHPMLVLDANKNMPIGFSSVQLWNREPGSLTCKERKYKSLPIEDKESYRWISSIQTSRDNLPEYRKLTFISDRESDIYEVLCLAQGDLHTLIRSSWDRVTTQVEKKLLDVVRSSELKHIYSIEIQGNKSRKSRTATLELQYCNVEIKRPERTIGDYPESVNMNCIYVKECAQSVPLGEKPIEWRLLTSHPVTTIGQAMQCVEWYRARWYIEELFRLLKTQGLNIEAAQLETGQALKKLMLFALQAALQVMILKIAYDKKRNDCSAKTILSDQQIMLLKIILPTVEGRTSKLKNPFQRESMPWATWIIARLGAWNAYTSQSPPGYISIKRGYDNFFAKMELFCLMKDVYKE